MGKGHTQNPHTYVALLRGINVGGHKKVPMADLKEALLESGFENPKTILASGNVVFQSANGSLKEVSKIFVDTLDKHFSFPIPLLIHPFGYIEEIFDLDPFKSIEVTKDTRRYVTFLPDGLKGDIAIPFVNEDQSYHILMEKNKAVFSVLTVGKTKSVDAMNILEKTYGKKITTRNWNTIIKLRNLHP